MSEDYTPTTEVVREVFAWRDGYPYEGAVDPQLEARFNRWLEEHDAEISTAAQHAAQERWDRHERVNTDLHRVCSEAQQKIAEQAAIIEAAKADCVEAWAETRKFRDDWTAAMHKITEQAATLEAVRIARAKVWPGTALRGVLIAQYQEIDKILADAEGKL